MRSRLAPLAWAFLCVVVLLSISGRAAAQPGPLLQPGDLTAVCGDSITEQKIYSVYIEDYMLMCQPVPNLRTLQVGWGGEVADSFWHRLGQDVLTLHPTVVTTCYGMNDGGYAPLEEWRSKWYRNALTNSVRDLRKGGVRLIIVGSPGCVDSDTFHNKPEDAVMYNTTLSALRDIAREVAQAEKVVFADVFDPMMEVMEKAKAKYGHAYNLAGGDGVHPSANGHLVMAYAFLKAMGCDGNIGTLTLDLATNQATGTSGHKVLSCAGGRVEVESTRYPFCFYGDPLQPGATTGVVEFFPFNKDLNRYMLVVKGCQAAVNYRVTWGATNKVFKGADLAQGINLAAEFMASPFRDAFAAVEKAVRAQQDYETGLTKTLLHNLPPYRDAFPEEAESLTRMQDKLIARDAAFARASVDAVVPVKHTILVEALGQ